MSVLILNCEVEHRMVGASGRGYSHFSHRKQKRGSSWRLSNLPKLAPSDWLPPARFCLLQHLQKEHGEWRFSQHKRLLWRFRPEPQKPLWVKLGRTEPIVRLRCLNLGHLYSLCLCLLLLFDCLSSMSLLYCSSFSQCYPERFVNALNSPTPSQY